MGYRCLGRLIVDLGLMFSFVTSVQRRRALHRITVAAIDRPKQARERTLAGSLCDGGCGGGRSSRLRESSNHRRRHVATDLINDRGRQHADRQPKAKCR